MHTSLFFKLFPPPKFMVMKHAGLDISDDSIHCLEYSGRNKNFKIAKYASIEIPVGVMEGGDIKDQKNLESILSKFDHDNDLSYVKVSIPEEKAYLFQTDISTTNPVSIAQNIEFKLEENVPLSISDAVFYFDILPITVTGGQLRASVSVVPRTYIEKIIGILRNAGISPIAFEVVPKAIARAVLPTVTKNTVMIIHIMHSKTGIYIVSGGVVCFTFTVAYGSRTPKLGEVDSINILIKEINRIYVYWASHGFVSSKIESIIVVGNDASKYEEVIRGLVKDIDLPFSLGNVWANSFSVDNYIPPISKEDSLEYVVSAGLAMDL